jgi:hypothetical protein
MKANWDSPYLQGAVSALQGLMAVQGEAKDAYHHRSLTPIRKARNVLAKLYEAGKTGEQLLEIYLTAKAAYAELGPPGYPDFPMVQIAKLAKRLRGASGTPYPGMAPPYDRRYPRAEGIYMRLLGRMIEKRAAHGIDKEDIEEVRSLAKPNLKPSQEAAHQAAHVADAQREREAMDAYLELIRPS